MTTTTLPAIAPTPATRARVRRAWDAYHAAVAEHGPADEWDKAVIDRVIGALAAAGKPFSVVDMRPLLPEVRKALISRRLIAAQNNGLVRKVGYTPSDLRSTHGAVVAVYEPVPTEGSDDRVYLGGSS